MLFTRKTIIKEDRHSEIPLKEGAGASQNNKLRKKQIRGFLLTLSYGSQGSSNVPWCFLKHLQTIFSLDILSTGT